MILTEEIILIGLDQPVNLPKQTVAREGEMPDPVAYRLDEGVATISMDDGKVNVMSTAMLRDLDAALDRAERDQAIVLLRSTRKDIFSAGFDLKIFAANDPERSLEMVKAGAELVLRLMSHPFPTIGLMEGHAFPMGTFLLLARSRVHPAWLSRTVTLGEMFEPDEAVVAGFLDRVVPGNEVERTIEEVAAAGRSLHAPSHALAKQRLRGGVMAAMRATMESELTLAAYQASAAARSGWRTT
jgi:enoyl-CoA hydratase